MDARLALQVRQLPRCRLLPPPAGACRETMFAPGIALRRIALWEIGQAGSLAYLGRAGCLLNWQRCQGERIAKLPGHVVPVNVCGLFVAPCIQLSQELDKAFGVDSQRWLPFLG